MALELAWYDWVGLLGTVMILGGFAFLQAGKLSGTGLVYQLLNLFGATGVLVSLLVSLSLTPALCARLLRARATSRAGPSSTPAPRSIRC